jgi:hypothetical protein
MLAKCEAETNSDLSLPFDERKTLIFVDWLVRVRNLKGATVNSYLAGVRQLHIVSNFDAPVIRTGLVKLVLKGSGYGIQSRYSHQVAYRQLYSTLSHSLQPLVPSCRISCSRLVPSSFSCHYH